jgi:RNA polymerase sigma-70 factor (ECF subfamily)
LYNKLLTIEYSPMAALNRTFALSKANGREEAILQAEKLKLEDNLYYYILLAELRKDTDPQRAKAHFLKALELARTAPEKQIIRRRLHNIDPSLYSDS